MSLSNSFSGTLAAASHAKPATENLTAHFPEPSLHTSDRHPTRVFDLPARQLALFPRADALSYKVGGDWKKFSTQEVVDFSDAVALGLYALGVRKGESIATISENNRPEWNFIDTGMLSLGAVHVPVYHTLTAEDYKYIFNDAGVKLIFVSSEALYSLVCSIAADIPTLQGVYTFDEVAGARNWKELIESSKKQNAAVLDGLKAAVQPGDLATLIYTSGTTGTPKGVMLSHKNLLSNCLVCADLMRSTANETALSFLPLCHIFERLMVNLYLYSGTAIYYAQSLTTVADDLKEVRPNLFATVPRLLEKIYDKIQTRGFALHGLKKTLFFWALELGLRYTPDVPQGIWFNTQLWLANKLVFTKWREALGGNVRAIVSGGAALQPRLARVFWAAGIRVYEGYGLSESSPVISVNVPVDGENKIGTIGPVISGGEVKIANDGEILYKGDNVMLGYYKRPDLTAETIDADGWLHTGDIGEFEGKFLKITDRKKEIFKTSGGKFIAPQVLENKLKESRYIEQVMVVGENRNFPAALIVPNFTNLKARFEHQGLTVGTHTELAHHPETLALIEREVSVANENFAHYMQVKKFSLLEREWTVATGELTATLKCKRKKILITSNALIESMYAHEEKS